MSKKPFEGHGGPHDRGGADSYYRRPKRPHWWPEGTGRGREIPESEMTPEEIQAYNDGFEENENLGHFKDWG